MCVWTACSDRLPEPGEQVVVIHWFAGSGPIKVVARYNAETKSFEEFKGDESLNDVSHWCALPPFPNPKADEA